MAPIEDYRSARQEAVDLGLIEDSGMHRVSPDGENEIVWRLTRLGKLWGKFRDDGLTREQAYVRAKSAVASPR